MQRVAVYVDLVVGLVSAGVSGVASVENAGLEREISRGHNRVNSEQPVEPHTAFAELSEVPYGQPMAPTLQINHPLFRLRLDQLGRQSPY